MPRRANRAVADVAREPATASPQPEISDPTAARDGSNPGDGKRARDDRDRTAGPLDWEHPDIRALFQLCTAGERCSYRVAGGFPLRDTAGPISAATTRTGHPRRAKRRRADGSTAWIDAQWYTGAVELRSGSFDLSVTLEKQERAIDRERPANERVFQPRAIIAAELAAHVRGDQDVAIVAGRRSRRLTLDIDAHPGAGATLWEIGAANTRAGDLACAIVTALGDLGITPVVQRSPRHGFHIDAFAARPVPSEQLRALGLAVLERAGIGDDEPVDVFPAPSKDDSGRGLRAGKGIRGPVGRGMVLCQVTEAGPVPDPEHTRRAARRCARCGQGAAAHRKPRSTCREFQPGAPVAERAGVREMLRAYLDRAERAVIPADAWRACQPAGSGIQTPENASVPGLGSHHNGVPLSLSPPAERPDPDRPGSESDSERQHPARPQLPQFSACTAPAARPTSAVEPESNHPHASHEREQSRASAPASRAGTSERTPGSTVDLTATRPAHNHASGPHERDPVKATTPTARVGTGEREPGSRRRPRPQRVHPATAPDRGELADRPAARDDQADHERDPVKATTPAARDQRGEREPGRPSAFPGGATFTDLVTAPVVRGTRDRRTMALVGALYARGLDAGAVRAHMTAWIGWHLVGDRADASRATVERLTGPSSESCPHRVISIPAGPVSAGELAALSADARALVAMAPAEYRAEVERIVARCEPHAGELRGLGKRDLKTIAGDRCDDYRGADGKRKRPRWRYRAVEWLRDVGYLTETRDYRIGEHEREYLIADAAPIAHPAAFALEAVPELFRDGPARAMPPARVMPAELPDVLPAAASASLEPAPASSDADPVTLTITAAVAAMLAVTSGTRTSANRTAFEMSARRTRRKHGKAARKRALENTS